jgi:hypothetical protein
LTHPRNKARIPYCLKNHIKILMNYYDFCVRQFQQNVSNHRPMKRDWLCINISNAISNHKDTSEDCWTFTTVSGPQKTLAHGPAGN